MKKRARATYIGENLGELHAFMEGVSAPLGAMLDKSVVRALRKNLLDWIFGLSGTGSTRTLGIWGDASDGSVSVGDKEKMKDSARVPGTFEARGLIAPALVISTDAALSSTEIKPDERDVNFHLELHGFAGLGALEETVRRICEVAHGVGSLRERDKKKSAHRTLCAELESALPAMAGSGPIDLSRFGLVGGLEDGQEGGQVRGEEGLREWEDEPTYLNLRLPWHRRRCLARYPRLWQLISKVSGFALDVHSGAEGPTAGSPGISVVISDKGIAVRCLVMERNGIWGEPGPQERRMREEGIWRGLRLRPKGDFAAVPFSSDDGFALPLRGTLNLRVKAVMGLASLPMPEVHFEACWRSSGGGGALVVRVTEVAAFPRVEWVIGLLFDVKRLKRLLVDSLVS